MTLLISWLAIAVVALFAAFIVKRILSLLLRRNRQAMHDEFVDVAEDVAAATRIAAALGSAAAFFAAPAGLMAVAVGFGIVPAPLIVTVLPALLVLAVGAAAASAGAKLYAKMQRRRAGRT